MKGTKRSFSKFILESKGNKKIDLAQFEKSILEGHRLKSSIPTGYGLGSSGSITAAIYDVFGIEKATDLDTLKQDLIDIESCFHGVSSGIDPLVIYLNKPIHIKNKKVQVLDQNLDMSHFFLIDTHLHRKTGPLVEQYLELANNSNFRNEIEKYKSLNSLAIEAQLNNDVSRLSEIMNEISRWQFQYLDFAILDEHRELWESTLDRSDVSLKHCGAGGGGFIIGYTEDVGAVIDGFCDFDLVRLG